MTQLSVGDALPRFEATLLGGEVINSQDLLGQPLLLNFYRYAACPVCAATLAPYLVRHWELKQRGVRLLAFFHSPAQRMRTYFEADKTPFDLVVDPTREIYEAFGVTPSVLGMLHPGGLKAVPSMFKHIRTHNPLGRDGTLAIMPADFLVNAQGRLVDLEYGRHLASGWSIDEALQRIEGSALSSVNERGALAVPAPAL